MRFIISLFIISVFTNTILAQEVQIIPQPVHLTKKAGSFLITKNTVIVIQKKEDKKSADFLNSYLKQIYGFQLPVQRQAALKSISISTKNNAKASDKDAYTFESSPAGVVIKGDTYAGTFYGMQTLIQLLPTQKSTSLKIPSVQVQDEPRFGHRGSLLDVGRHCFPVEYIKKYIDYLALHKMNYFHWHLTEDAGWRIEIKKYPKLTEVGAWRDRSLIGRYPGIGFENKRYGGYYTQEQIKDIVQYAADRYITILPEIEMPGHSYAALASYPELGCSGGPYKVPEVYRVDAQVFCAGKDYTFEFLQNVLDEVLELFPSKFIHIGGDECPKDGWKNCPRCQERIKKEGLKDEHELQSYFIRRIEQYLNSKGRTLVGWDEILEGGLAPNAVVMSWRGESGGIAAAKEKHHVIMTPSSHVYFDYSEVKREDSVTIGYFDYAKNENWFTPIEKVYHYEPIPKELSTEESKYVLGAQGNVWSEYITNPSKVEYMLFPRISALSEVLWAPKEKKNWSDFEKRLIPQLQRYKLWKVNYNKAHFDLEASVLPTETFNGVYWKLSSNHPYGEIRYITSTGPEAYHKPIRITNTGSQSASLTVPNNGKMLVQQAFKINKATGKKISLTNGPSDNFLANGAFTLVDGIQNTKGLDKQTEFLGFLGTDCEAVIDLGKTTSVRNVKVHYYHQKGSWIYPPQSVEVLYSGDGNLFTSMGAIQEVSTGTGNAFMEKSFTPVAARFVKVLIKNKGDIEGNPYGNHKAWLLVDEIEVN